MDGNEPEQRAQLWDDAEFLARIHYYAKHAGRSARQVVLAAGLSGEYLHGKPNGKGGRSIEGILLVARVLGIDPCALIPAADVYRRFPQDANAMRLRLNVAIEVELRQETSADDFDRTGRRLTQTLRAVVRELTPAGTSIVVARDEPEGG